MFNPGRTISWHTVQCIAHTHTHPYTSDDSYNLQFTCQHDNYYLCVCVCVFVTSLGSCMLHYLFPELNVCPSVAPSLSPSVCRLWMSRFSICTTLPFPFHRHYHNHCLYLSLHLYLYLRSKPLISRKVQTERRPKSEWKIDRNVSVGSSCSH